jgi:gliding motility-associated-like protein
MLVEDASGCEAMASHTLQPTINVPCNTAIKVITPNNDGKNDFFIISCVFDFDSRLYVFNRFGGLVYETADYQNDWSGQDQNGEPVPDGGYLWVLEMVRQDGTTQLAKGTVNVIRTAD